MAGLEENFAKIESLLGELGKEDISLEASFKAYQEGMALLAACDSEIDRIEKAVLTLQEDGSLGILPDLSE